MMIIYRRYLKILVNIMSGRSAVWLARHVRDVEVLGSNPSAPTILQNIFSSNRNPFMGQAQRVQAVFSGNVQSVSFRFTAERLASQNGVADFVRNLPEGRTEIVCEASQDQLESFLRRIKKDMCGYISDF